MKINYDLMRQVCLSPIDSFTSLGTVTETMDGIYILKENPNAKILGVAHLDTVLDMSHFYHVKINGSKVLNAQLDDRLGVYTMLDLLPKVGIEFDLLLTEGEERGMSTAAHFDPLKAYNWIFSFDRHGDDVVMYQYETKQLKDCLKKAGFRPSYGTFSDISSMSHLGVSGFNVGTGYEGEHSTMCYADINKLIAQVKRFKIFYDLFKDVRMDYVPTKRAPIMRGRYNYDSTNWRDDRWWDYADKNTVTKKDEPLCALCHEEDGTTIFKDGIYICDHCINYAAECTQCHVLVYDDETIDGICYDCIDTSIKNDKDN